MNSLPIYIINLLEREDRRIRATEQLAELDLEHHFIEAVKGAQGKTAFEGINRTLCFLSLGRQPSNGELGCYASHLKLWKKCLELNHPIAVMEDDFRLKPGFAEALQAANVLLDTYPFIRLDSLQRGRFRESDCLKVARHEAFDLVYLLRVPLNATAYALTPEAAARLVDASQSFTTPTDNFFQRNWSFGLPIFALRPEPVDLDALAEDSSIVESDRDRKSLAQRVSRLLRLPYRAWASFSRKRFNAKQMASIQPLK